MLDDSENIMLDVDKGLRELLLLVRAKLTCEIISTIGTGALVMYFTAGAGSPVLLRAISESILKVVNALPPGSPSAARLAALSEKVGEKATQAQIDLEMIKGLKSASDRAKWELKFHPQERCISSSCFPQANLANYGLMTPEALETLRAQDIGLFREVTAALEEADMIRQLQATKASADQLRKEMKRIPLAYKAAAAVALTAGGACSTISSVSQTLQQTKRRVDQAQ